MERIDILNEYRQMMTDRWRKGRINLNEILDNILALKVFCEVHQLNLEEHETAVDEVGLDRGELIDSSNQPFADWLKARRQLLPTGSGGLRFAAPMRQVMWKMRLPQPPTAWQNAVAGVAALVTAGCLGAIIIIIMFSV
jgi:hypothetical protein